MVDIRCTAYSASTHYGGFQKYSTCFEDSRTHTRTNKTTYVESVIVNYLVSKGISRSRLSAKGYGETRLVNRCSNDVECSENEHQRNRRTEFRVLNN